MKHNYPKTSLVAVLAFVVLAIVPAQAQERAKDESTQVIVIDGEELLDNVLYEIEASTEGAVQYLEAASVQLEGELERLHQDLERAQVVWDCSKKPSCCPKGIGNGAFLGVEFEKTADNEGVRITKVIEGSAAEVMGLEEGDIIMDINGDEINNGDLASALRAFQPGDVVELKVKRKRRTKEMKGVLGRRAAPSNVYWQHNLPQMTTTGKPKLGVHIAEKEGNVVIESIIPNSTAQEMGLQAGDVIESINKTDVHSIPELIEAIQAVGAGEEIEVKYQREGKTEKQTGTLKEVPMHSFFNNQFRFDFDSLQIPKMEKFFDFEDGEYEWLNEDFPSNVKVIILRGNKSGPSRDIVLKSLGDGSEEIRVLESDLELSNLELYPNPSEGQLTISFNTNGNNEVNIKVLSIDNREVYNGSFSDLNTSFSQTLDLGNNPPGLYILQIESGGKSYFERVVIK